MLLVNSEQISPSDPLVSCFDKVAGSCCGYQSDCSLCRHSHCHCNQVCRFHCSLRAFRYHVYKNEYYHYISHFYIFVSLLELCVGEICFGYFALWFASEATGLAFVCFVVVVLANRVYGLIVILVSRYSPFITSGSQLTRFIWMQ